MAGSDADPNPWTALSASLRPSEDTAVAWLRGLGNNPAAPPEVLVGLFDAGPRPCVYFLYRDDLPDGVLDAAVVHPAKSVRVTAAEAGRLSPAQWSRLRPATDDPALRAVLAELAADQASYRASGARIGVANPPRPGSRPPSTPAEIATMAAAVPDITADSPTYAVWWIAALHSDTDAMRRLAASPNLLIRRSVARAPRLPPDVVELLAHDTDRVVRLFLSESCEDAPADLLLEVWSWWSGSFSFPGRPRNHPNFPRHGLLRFAEDPAPRMRLLALDDPASSALLVERFSHDPDALVRTRAALDPRLSAASAVRLTGDADHHVHSSARRNPALPADALVSSLLDDHCAEAAARNPAIPTAVMHRMISLATPRQRP
ncbi:hypothetical protein [Streptomyces sp. NBC_01104]|uniref:hypothetical protein n=1 Tax=Streptomyces sp. NBC_01104 TaxID=2903750 RepID=UPI003865C95F|nr:hypothetical protein OG450_04445 [Streptomyces sp. NBC_01104]